MVIYSQKPEYKDILNEETNYVMLKLLQGVVNKGTANRLRQPKNKNKNLKGDNYETLNNIGYEFTNEIAGKTGTTVLNYTKRKNEEKKKYQASFIGFFPAESPKYSCIVVTIQLFASDSKYFACYISDICCKKLLSVCNAVITLI